MKYPYVLPQLNYSYNSLEPYIDTLTMEIHHTKHHQAYINSLNNVLDSYPQLQQLDLEAMLKNQEQVPETIRKAVINFGGGHYNHSLFWEIIGPAKDKNLPEGEIAQAIDENFGSFENFKNLFSEVALKHFGSGWAWLVLDKEKKLKVYSLPNQDTPLVNDEKPLMLNDIWEHAYYLKYQNRRNEYIQNWWYVVDWKKVNENYLKAKL